MITDRVVQKLLVQTLSTNLKYENTYFFIIKKSFNIFNFRMIVINEGSLDWVTFFTGILL